MLTKIAFWPRRCVKGQLRCQFCGKKWKCNFLHAANVAVLRPRSCSGQQEQGGDVAKLTFHISRHHRSPPHPSGSRQASRADERLWEGCCSCRIWPMSTKIAFWPPRCVLNRLRPAPNEVAAAPPDAAPRECKTYTSISCHPHP